MVQPVQEDFGVLVKQWRARRRESQAELGNRAGVSARHLSFLETGRARPSREMVSILATALGVAPRERNALLRAAGFADAFPESRLDSAALEPALRALRFVLDRHEPCPSMVIDGSWNVVLTNRAASRLLRAFVLPPFPAPLNALRVLLEPGGLRPHIENWAGLARTLVERLQIEVVNQPPDAPGRALLRELLELPGVRDALGTQDKREVPLPFVPLVLRRGASKLSLFSVISSFGTPIDLTLHELRIETLLPADESSEAALRELSPARKIPA